MKKIVIAGICLIAAVMCLLLIENSLTRDKEKDQVSEAYIYKGNTNADGIEIDKVLTLYGNKNILENLGFIKKELENGPFKGIQIDLVGIKDGILTVNLIDGEKKVTEYLDSGSAGGKMALDVLTYSLLQPESEIEDWITGLKILLNGEENAEGSHFNLEGVFNRDRKYDKTLVYITDYGYEGALGDYDEEVIINNNSQRFILEPAKDTTLIVSEGEYTENGFVETKELLTTDKKLLFETELPEGGPNTSIKAVRGDRTSTWTPFFNGKDGTLIVPEEFLEIKLNGTENTDND